MSDPFNDQKRRPPPLKVPPVPGHLPAAQSAHPPRVSSRQQQHRPHEEHRNPSTSTHQGSRSVTNPLTSPLECDGSRLPPSHTGSQKSRTTAIDALSQLIEESRDKSSKLERSSTVGHSTNRSRHSQHDHHTAIAAQAKREALNEDERTSRAKIEARSELTLFKMTGQVPPTPMLNATSKDAIIIVRQDLREECRAATAEKKPELQDPIKSPKKKLFGINIPSFSRSSNNTPAPRMPSKAAQVLGEEPRNPTKVVVRPIKPSGYANSPTKAPRSDTSKSLPSKVLDQSTYTRSHHTGTARRNRAANRRSPPRSSKQSFSNENTPPVPNLNTSFESAVPPTPPAKDTPPEGRAAVRSTSPLRRALPASDRLRENFEVDVAHGERIPFPAFALSPSPSKHHSADAGRSPTKHLPFSAVEYEKLISGEPLPWSSVSQDDSPENHRLSLLEVSPMGGNLAGPMNMPAKRWSEEEEMKYYEQFGEEKDTRSAPLEGENQQPLQELARQERRGDEYVQSNRSSDRYPLLPPRFYSPSNRSVAMFAPGETPSKNSDTKRLLCTVTSRADLFDFRNHSNNGSIEMMFQGDVNDIHALSSNGHLADNNPENTMLVQTREEFHIEETRERNQREAGSAGLLQPDQSSSRLTDMLHGVSPRRDDSNGDFRANCPSAVPSPLHKGPTGRAPIHPMAPMLESPASSRAPFAPKSLNDHFYMTNEHIDVIGKSNWDHVEAMKKELHGAANHRHAQLVSTIEKQVGELKMQVDSVNQKADRATEQSHNIHTKLDELFDFIKGDVMGALHMQDTKMSDLELGVKELQKTVQNMQKTLEQKQSEPKASQQHAAPAPTLTLPLVDRPQMSLGGYYGNMTESGRESQPSTPHVLDHRNGGLPQETHSDPRTSYGNYAQQWAPRAGYQGRSSKEERPYATTNPYNFANGTANGGQYGNSNGYNGGYSYN
ncbi:hypothetical protein CC86DRAFT_359069 [Ophiobolus disseminans]|uniref:Uncharacterized protein n=1 Tax=Ophiobolus disseminans TaxID=1469910 RepID=A0A6A6ZM57_9PLEO|nr:hypothetical protein CC86DRAFT_359069 [Ophiobolus disseminans]